MNKDMSVCAVVVTYNKLDLLKECLNAIRNQTYKVNTIIVVNNDSTDGTTDFLDAQDSLVKQVKMDQNLGGAGGFKSGLKEFATKAGDEYCWIMDDDTIPDKECLELLMESAEKVDNNFGFLSSFAYWIDDTPCVMNVPKLSKTWSIRGKSDLLSVDQATFVSVLIKKEVVFEVGLPIGEFFIWGDDTEYTGRISKKYNSFYSLNSQVLHKMKSNLSVDIVHEDYQRVARYFYHFRNRFYLAKKRGIGALLKEILRGQYNIFKVLFLSSNHRFVRIKQIIKGQWAGIGFNPKIEKV